MVRGFIQSIAPCDDAGNVIVDPTDPKARSLRFAIDPNVPDAPQDQLELKADVESALSAIQRIYPDASAEADFRPFFVRIAGAAQVGLVGDPCHPEVGTQALAGAVSDLIEREGGQVKNKHLRALALKSAILCLPLLALYALFRFLLQAGGTSSNLLGLMFIGAKTASSFMIMLAGCLLGVTLSYAARTTTLTLKDLTTPDVERLRPNSRLLVSAGWTMLFGYLIVLEVFVVQVGAFTTKSFSENPMIAFVLGTICGLSNLTLPGIVSKKASESLP